MHAGAMQTLVVVFPEDLPVAVHRLLEGMPENEVLQGPRVEAIQRSIEHALEGRRVLRQGDEYEAAPLVDLDPVERVVRKIEPFRVRLRGGAQ